MKIAIISDVHNNETNLKKVLNYCEQKKIKKIICCGDLASDETLDFMTDNFGGEIFYTFGNMDNEQLREFQFVDVYKNVNLFKKFGELELDSKKIAFVHYPREAEGLARTGKYDFVFYGHTHKPWISHLDATGDHGKCVLLNPGNVAGEIYLPTFATWNTKDDNFELIRVHDLK
ncbi:MAG: YfcE family phosphodiesterase [Parcubacteria group bacterium]|jgi:hypothetical protein